VSEVLAEYTHEILLLRARVTGVLLNDFNHLCANRNDFIEIGFYAKILAVNLKNMNDRSKARPFPGEV
jgi:hypothetical protein